MKQKRKTHMAWMILLLIICLAFLLFMAFQLRKQYRENTVYGSAAHLTEITRQSEQNIEEMLLRDQNVAGELAHALQEGRIADENALFDSVDFYKKLWTIDEIVFYTEDGMSRTQDGILGDYAGSATFAAEVVQKGKAFRVIKSKVEYGMAVSTDLTISGSKIAAVSVEHDLSGLMDQMGLQSFEKKGSFYLTRQNGAEICRSSGENSKAVYNLLSWLEEGSTENLTGGSLTISETMDAGKEGAFLLRGAEGSDVQYVILLPVHIMEQNMYLFNIVPQSVMNQNTDAFTRDVVLLALAIVLMLVGVFLLFMLRSSRYQAEMTAQDQKLRDALTMADSANRAKTQFLSSVSHDIRTPLNAVINMSRFLSEEITDRKQSEELGVIRESSEHLLNLINDVLDMSRIESGKLTFHDAPFDMQGVLAGVCEMIRPLCEAKKQKFVFECGEMTETHLTGDALRLNQILINLLNNAVKYTPEHGEIHFTVQELKAIAGDELPFRFTVRDNGIGIPEDRLTTIFQPFTRVENETVRETEGSGLGLAITKSFVDALGGSIAVESRVGEGSVFAVELNYRPGDGGKKEEKAESGTEESCTEAQNARFDGRRALVVEDNAVNLMIASTILKKRGFLVESAGNGAEAVRQYEAHPAEWYDIIYMDIQMPVENGYDAAREIRASGQADAGTIPIVAMTANAFAEDMERARAAGMDAHLAKPIEPEEVYRVSCRLLQNHPQQTGENRL